MSCKTSLLQETIEILNDNGKSPTDVEWVGKYDGYYTWKEFEKQAKDIRYDSGWGYPEINMSLVVVGKDFWLERHEYDGSEWWEFKTLPIKPDKKVDKLVILNE